MIQDIDFFLSILQLTNTGDSDLTQVLFAVSYPLRIFKGEEHQYIVYPTAIKVSFKKFGASPQSPCFVLYMHVADTIVKIRDGGLTWISSSFQSEEKPST